MKTPEPVQDLVDHFLAEVDARLPGELTGLFLHESICCDEFFPGSDVDFVAVWDHLPSGEGLDALAQAHAAVTRDVPSLTFDGFHCTEARSTSTS